MVATHVLCTAPQTNKSLTNPYMSISKCPSIITHTILKPPIPVLNFILIIIVQQRWHPNCTALVEEVVEILRW